MSENLDKWKIRFGQIFQRLLGESGKNLEDYLYFLPTGFMPDIHSEESFKVIDLNIRRSLFDRYFSGDLPPVPALTQETAARLDATLVLVPGFGHHLIKQRAFGDQISLFRDLGFNVVYASYGNSFDSNKKCAERVYRILQNELDTRQKLLFFTYSKGSPVIVEMLSDPGYAEVIQRTRAVVSFAGALRGSVLASSRTTEVTLRLLKAYRAFSQRSGSGAKLLKWMMGEMPRFQSHAFKEWNDLLEKVAELAQDLADLPEGITDLTRVTCETNYAKARINRSVKLFSISAVYPEAEFKEGLRFITNPDDLFLYVSGRELYKHNVFNDTQILLPDSEFFEGTGDITNLGIVKADHWGIAMPRVFSRHYEDPFPRTEMLKAVLLVLDEYFGQLANNPGMEDGK